MNPTTKQPKNPSGAEVEGQHACEFEKFPQPRTMPEGWDLSELMTPPKQYNPEKYANRAQPLPKDLG